MHSINDDYAKVNSQVSVVAIHPNNRPGNVKAYAIVRVGPFTLHGLKIVKQAQQRPYIAWPQVERAGKFYPVLKCDDEALKNEVAALILEAWQNGGAA